jgi:hypothetical protein
LLTTSTATTGDTTRRFHMPRATRACAQNPNDPCCRSCLLRESTPPSGCTELAEDPECRVSLILEPRDDDPLNTVRPRLRSGYFDSSVQTRRVTTRLPSRSATDERSGRIELPWRIRPFPCSPEKVVCPASGASPIVWTRPAGTNRCERNRRCTWESARGHHMAHAPAGLRTLSVVLRACP